MSRLEQLQSHLRGRTLVVGVGNPQLGDDGAGIVLVRKLSPYCSDCCLEAGVAPENHLEPICRRRPDTVLFADALDMGASPGEWTILDPAWLDSNAVSSHALSLRTCAEYIQRRCGAHCRLLGIQPGQTHFQQGLSPKVAAAVDEIVPVLAAILQSSSAKPGSRENLYARS